jgi:peroxiredoxin Q/BCP
MLEIGDTAPEFELLNSKEENVKLADFRGKRIVLFFYPKADTPGCTKQACGFRDNFPLVEEANATVIGLSPDKPAALAKWKTKQNFPFTLLSDSDHQVANAYGAWGEKKSYGRTYEGIIRSHFVIDAEGKLEDIQINVRPETSVSRAITTLQS